MELPELPPEWDWANVMKLGDECDEASVLIYGAEVASRMKVAGLMLKQMPQIMRAYGEQCILLERARCIRICEEERVDAEGSGRREDFAYNNAIAHCIDAMKT